jgi:hypothetical protein
MLIKSREHRKRGRVLELASVLSGAVVIGKFARKIAVVFVGQRLEAAAISVTIQAQRSYR